MASKSKRANEPPTDRGFADHERAQIRRLAKLPLVEKLRWLEEAHRLVLHLSRGQV